MSDWRFAAMTEGLLHTPIGETGSGRVRYGAAMALYQAGQLTAEVLEVYRELSAHDGRDPLAVLAERGLPLPGFPVTGAAPALASLVAEIDRYLATLPGEGPVDVRMAIARCGGRLAGQDPSPNPVLAAHLPTALAALKVTHPALAFAIANAAGHLRWITYDGYPRDQIGDGFAAGHAYASVIGDDDAVRAQDFDLGLFLIAPHVLYRDRHHAAPELYAPLTGPHGWRFQPGAQLLIKQAHEPVWNTANRPHLTKVGPVPFLCIYCWTRDALAPTHVIPADDWPALEALRL
jgi:Dimethlysulfonioproprionate lyase